MAIPSLPNVPIDMDAETRNFLESLEGKLDEIDVARVEGEDLYVLGLKKEFYDLILWDFEIVMDRVSGQVRETSFKKLESIDTVFARAFSFGLYELSSNIRQRKIQTKEYERKVAQYKIANLNDIKEKVKDVRIYQGNFDEVQRELGRSLERVDTGKPETFLEAHGPLWLRVEAYLHGADAIIHYQPGSSIGTPVRYTDKKV